MQQPNIQPNQPAPAAQPAVNQGDVGFPKPPSKNKSGFPKWLFAIVGVLVIVIAGGLFLFSNYFGADEEGTPSPTPESGGLKTFVTPEPRATTAPTATPNAEPVDKSELGIEVLNGTGTAGEAGYLKAKLEALDYTNVSAGNADSQEETRTTVTFDSDLSQDIIDEIAELLEKEYEQVRTRKSSLSGADVSIVTGPRKGASSTSSSSATATPEASPSASPEASEG